VAKNGSSGDSAERLTQKEAAARLGITPRALRKLGSDHPVPRNADGKYPWPRVRHWYIGFKQDEAVSRKTGGALAAADSGTQDTQAANYYRARARKEEALAGLRELELAQLQGELITVAEFEELLSELFGTLRSRLLALPGLIAPRLASKKLELGQVVQVVDDELHGFLSELADQGAPLSANGDGSE